MFIFDSNRFARDRAALPAEIEGMIKSAGGDVLVSRLWEERRLAYAINGQRKGTYWLIYFRGPSTAIDPLNRQCEIHDSVLRQLVLKIHPHLVDAVLAHAMDEPSHPKPPETAHAGTAKPARARGRADNDDDEGNREVE
jgi:small subunit ribosomal protein S6